MATKLITPRLPQGLFILAHDPDLSESEAIQNDMFDGPYDGRNTATDPGGTTVLLSEGLPYPIAVTEQDGTLLMLAGGAKMRVFPWRTPTS